MILAFISKENLFMQIPFNSFLLLNVFFFLANTSNMYSDFLYVLLFIMIGTLSSFQYE